MTALGLSSYEFEIVNRAIAGDELTKDERGELTKIGRLIESKLEYVKRQMGALIDSLDEESTMKAEFREKLGDFEKTAREVIRVAAERGADGEAD